MVQGDLKINDYCKQMKELVDALKYVGHPVSEPQLVLNLLRGLNPEFSNTADHIAEQDPFPSFTKARGILVLKEMRNANSAAVAAKTALLANPSCGPSGCLGGSSAPAPIGGSFQPRPPAPQQGARPPATSSGSNNRRNNNRRCNSGGGGGNGGQRPQQSGGNPGGPWICLNPWALPGVGQSGAPRFFLFYI